MTTGGLMRDILFTDVSITGNRLSATAQSPNGDRLELHLTVTGNTITGEWASGPQSAELQGTRVSDATRK